jgi:beta-glucosidase
MFPVSIAMGATWDPELVHEVATAISDEARAINNLCLDDPDFRGQRKGLIYRAPVINIERNPYWGRNEEAYGEDPYLTGRLGVAYVKGLQGDHPRYLKLVSTLKHYAVNNVERNRQSLSATVSERMLHEYWLPHFRDCIVEGRAQSVMASYNAINGTPNNINRLLLTEILKKRWGFKGFVVSDLGGVHTMVRGHARGQMSYEDAVAQSLIAGCDFSDREFEEHIPEAVRNGLLPESRLDDAVFRVLFNRFRLGEFDLPEMVPYRQISAKVIASAEHRELALKAAQKSIVLLSNTERQGRSQMRATARFGKTRSRWSLESSQEDELLRDCSTGCLLPLDRDAIKTIAVIGPHADRFTSGNYSGQPDRPVSPLQGIRNRVRPGTEILYARGTDITDGVPLVVDRENGFSGGRSVKLDSTNEGDYLEFPIHVAQPGEYEIELRYKTFPSRGIFRLSVDGVEQGELLDMYSAATRYDNTFSFGKKQFDSPGTKMFRFTVVGRNRDSTANTGHFDRVTLSGPQNVSFEAERLDYSSGTGNREESIAEAVDVASRADAAIVYVGTSNAVEQEGRDRRSLGLPGRQEELVKAVVAANPKTVVVLMNAGPLTVPWIKEHAPAILEAWWNGVEGGNAIADVIFGNVNPGGRLPHTVYASEDQVPSQDEYDISKGYTYMYLRGEPLFGFGHGLSYTAFEYSNLKLSHPRIRPDGTLTIEIDVENAGNRVGDEVVQLYVRDIQSSVVRPAKELRGFERITLSPGEKRTVTFSLKGKQLAFWDEVERHDFVVEPGEFELHIGSSSQDIRARGRFEVIDSGR